MKNKLPLHKRLSFKISLVLSVLFSIFVISVSFVLWKIEAERITDKASESFKNSKEWAQIVFSEPVWSYDQGHVHEIAKSMVSSPERFIVAIQVKDRDGEVLADHRRPEYENQNIEGMDQDTYLVESFPLIHQSEKVGEVYAVAKPQTLYDYLKGVTALIWTSASLLILLTSLVSFFTLEKLLTNPLKEMIINLKKVESADYRLNLTQDYSNELETLAESFRSAIHHIARRDESLKLYSQNLEALVEHRTQELDQERMRSITSAKLASLGEISAGVAHEINNPLAVIEGKVYLMQNYLAEHPDSKALENHLSKVSEMVQRIGKIIKSLRYFSRDATQDPPELFSIHAVIEEVKTLCAMRIRERGIDLVVQAPLSENLIAGREVQLCQVLVNLLQNAMDAAQDQTKPYVEVHVGYQKEFCVVSVCDNGPGVPSHLLEKIFQPFFTTKGVGKGTGLGLSISHGIVKQHGGDLTVKTENGMTRFEFTLPLAKAKQMSASVA